MLRLTPARPRPCASSHARAPGRRRASRATRPAPSLWRATPGDDGVDAADGPTSRANLAAAPADIFHPPTAARSAVALAAASAVLGPCCDTLHSRFGVLTYARPTVDAPPWLVTCWWVPPLFAGAGILIGLGVPALDALAGRDHPPRPWPAVLATIAGFVGIYALSAVLEARLRGQPVAMGGVLAAAAAAHWYVCDRTPASALLGAAAAVAGPVVEAALIRGGGLYAYADAAVAGAVPAWIPWVYAAGGAAVGGLGRRVVADVGAAERGRR